MGAMKKRNRAGFDNSTISVLPQPPESRCRYHSDLELLIIVVVVVVVVVVVIVAVVIVVVISVIALVVVLVAGGNVQSRTL